MARKMTTVQRWGSCLTKGVAGILAALLTWLPMTPAASADTITWDGDAGDGLWSTAANWDGDAVPDPADDVDILKEAGTVHVDTDLVVNGSVTLDADVVLIVDAGERYLKGWMDGEILGRAVRIPIPDRHLAFQIESVHDRTR